MDQHLGRYRLLHRIALGGMSETFVGERTGAHGFTQRVCVKRIHAEDATKQGWPERFQKEAHIGAKLRHSNIVTLYEFGKSNDVWWMSLELIDGVTLRRLMNMHTRAGTPMPVDVVLTVAGAVAEALAYIHGQTAGDGSPTCIVHRDVTPTNILISRAGEVKLSDFGIATVLSEERTRTGKAIGKMTYASPEHARGTTIDHRSDFFSLGVVLFEMLAGRRPYDGATLAQTLKNAVDGRKKDLTALAPHTPEPLVRLVESLIASNPDDRPDDADALLDALCEIPVRAGVVRALGTLVSQAKASAADDGEEPTAIDDKPPPAAGKPAISLATMRMTPTRLPPNPDGVLTVYRVTSPQGRPELVGVHAIGPAQQPGMETSLIWPAPPTADAAALSGRTERELIALLGEPDRRVMKMLALLDGAGA